MRWVDRDGDADRYIEVQRDTVAFTLIKKDGERERDRGRQRQTGRDKTHTDKTHRHVLSSPFVNLFMYYLNSHGPDWLEYDVWSAKCACWSARSVFVSVCLCMSGTSTCVAVGVEQMCGWNGGDMRIPHLCTNRRHASRQTGSGKTSP